MATLLLSAGGAALGGAFGGSVAGITSGVLGKAVGATVGAIIDQRLTGVGSEPVETGRVDRLRMMGASEGAALPRVFGRIRVGGQVIWASNFLETVNSSRTRGKGTGGASQEMRAFSYSVSLAVALCEGEVARVGRIWADGQALDQAGLTWRLHSGSDDQSADPLISALEGPENTPTYRGTAYVVFENLGLAPFGNRVPQFSFEVFRRPNDDPESTRRHVSRSIEGVALVPGAGEYCLATTPVFFEHGPGESVAVNLNNDRGAPDLVVSLDQMRAELPAAKAVSLVVSWFGNDLRCDKCELRPMVEQKRVDGSGMPWRVGGQSRQQARQVSQIDGRPLFGGTPTDASILQAIAQMRAGGQNVMFYPFILMDILADNRLPDPWTDNDFQPAVPWRGRITCSVAPGRVGSPDKTPAAAEQVRRFFGEAAVSDFRIVQGEVIYAGPEEWSYRRFILHYASLCAMSDGVDAFCIGSEMRSLTQIRDGVTSYPAVRALQKLADDVRSIVGARVRIGYAADWSEYFSHIPNDGSNDVIYNLDPLWAQDTIDFVGIDNYMPLSDWRDGSEHLDAGFGSIYDQTYLRSNVAGGEGYNWFYADQAGRDRQDRTPVADTAYGEDWVFRYKDIRAWWERRHTNRIMGVKQASATAWVPQSKPIWFTELGCPAIDKGSNQPNVFIDPKSSESFMPYYSSGARDDYMQQACLRASIEFYSDPDNNPMSVRYDGSMVDTSRVYVWTWDARPWPDFPDRLDTWVDGVNFDRGHWINTRIIEPSLAEIVSDCCVRSGLQRVETKNLHGSVVGYAINEPETTRQTLQPLMLAFAFDCFSIEHEVAFRSRGRVAAVPVAEGQLVAAGSSPAILMARTSSNELPNRVIVNYIRDTSDYEAAVAEASSPESSLLATNYSSLNIVLSGPQAKAIVDRWLGESLIATETGSFELAPSGIGLMAGDTVSFQAQKHRQIYRIDRTEDFGARSIEVVKIESDVYGATTFVSEPRRASVRTNYSPVFATILDLPLISGEEVPHAPHVAVSASPWVGAVSVFTSTTETGYRQNTEVYRPATCGWITKPVGQAASGVWYRGDVRVRLSSGTLSSMDYLELLGGANVFALQDRASGVCEVLQFRSATLVGPREYVLKDLLRGQAGTDATMPAAWAVGSEFILLDSSVVQIDASRALRAVPINYRIGSSQRSYDDPSYIKLVRTSQGVGMRPLSPVHLSAEWMSLNTLGIRWIRRTRIDGDTWTGLDVPLGEEKEIYEIKLVSDGEQIIEQIFDTNTAIIEISSLDLSRASKLKVQVSQISSVFGSGPVAELEVVWP